MTKEVNTKKDIITPNDRWFKFHELMLGYKCYLDGKEVAKSTLFWMQERSINISKRLNTVKVVKV